MGDVNALIHRERVPAATGAWSIRPPGLSGITPKFCLIFCHSADSDLDDVIEADGCVSQSFFGSESAYCQSYITEDGLASADVQTVVRGDTLAALIRPDRSYQLLVDTPSFVAGGIDCTVTTNVIRPNVSFVFLYGDDLQVYQERVPGIGSGSRVVNTGFTGVNNNQLGFFFQALSFGKPTLGEEFSSGSICHGLACRRGAAGPPNAQGLISFSQWQGGSSAFVYQYTQSGAICIATNSTGTINSEFTASDVQDDQWTLTLTRGSAQFGVYATILSTSDNQAWCKLLDSPLVSPWIESSPGFTPQIAALVVGQKTTDNDSIQQGNTGIFGLSAGTDTDQALACLSSEDGVGTMVAKCRQSAKFVSYLEDDGTVGWEQATAGDFSLQPTGFRVDNLTLPTGTSGAKKWLAWAIEGVAGPPVIEGTGALQAQDAAVVGVGEVISPTIITGTGTLQAQEAAVVGVGFVEGLNAGTGVLQAQDASVSGVGDVISPVVGTGTLQAQDAQVSGVGAVVHAGSGTLQAQDSAVVGVGEVGNVRTGTGALQAGEAAVVGTGIRVSVGSGALQAQDAAVTGAGVVEGLTSGTGVLQAQSAAVAGTGHLIRVGSGALQAQAAQVAGVGAILGEITLSPADIAAIADAVYAKLVNEGLVEKINEIWQRRGLDPANPQTYDKAGNEIRVGNIKIGLSGDANSVTQSREHQFIP